MRGALCRGLSVLLAAAPAAGRGQEIAPFRLTGIDGQVNVRYLNDQLASLQAVDGLASRSRQAQSDFRTEIFVMTHSYVYHPKFLTLDIGGGPILDRQSYSSDGGAATTRGSLYNFSGRANFFRDKPLRGSLFYDHLNPTVTLAPGEVLTQENTRYGFDLTASAAFSPVPARLAFTRMETAGRSAERSVDDRTEQWSLSASRSYGALGTSQLHYQATRQESRSGSVNLPIQASTSNSQGMNLDTRLQFGADRQYDLANLVAFNTRSYALAQNALPEQRDLNFLLDLRARHSASLNSFGLYNFNSSRQGEIASTSQAFASGLDYAPGPDFEAALGLRADDNRNRQYAMRVLGVDGSLRYQHALPVGTAQASYGFRYDRRDQQASQPQAPVIGERVVLNGSAYVALARPHVVPGSVAVVNATRSQTYVENVDYRVSVLGSATRIQRLVGGSILDGEEVLVDYSYDTGGTYAYHQLDQTLNVDWGISRWVNAYFRRFDASPRLVSGAPSFPLNAVLSSVYGLRADFPCNPGVAITLGGSFERENRRETVSPFRRESDDLYLQTDESLFGLGNFRFAARRSRVEYGNSAQNVDLQGYDLNYWARPWYGVDLSATASIERDRGGSLPRRRLVDTLNAQWRERKLTLSATLQLARETQGGFERRHALFQINLRRDF